MRRRKDGRYQKLITIDGKRISFYSSEPTEKKAIKDIERQLLNYNHRKVKGPLFSEIARQCETEHRENLPEMTFKKTYAARYKAIVNEFGDKYIKEIKPKDIDVYFKMLKAKYYA